MTMKLVHSLACTCSRGLEEIVDSFESFIYFEWGKSTLSSASEPFQLLRQIIKSDLNKAQIAISII